MQAHWLIAALSLLPSLVLAGQLERFGPIGSQVDVHQVQAHFTSAMVPLGRSEAVHPFEITCSRPGKGYWVDERTWVYDLPEGLLAGDSCRFIPNSGLKDHTGETVSAQPEYSFQIAGPVIQRTLPYTGTRTDESQSFVLLLNGPADGESIEAHVRCEAQGIQEAIPIKRVIGAARKKVLQASEAEASFGKVEDALIEVVQCSRPLPSNAKFDLVWGIGVTTLTHPASHPEQRLTFQVRDSFSARVSCTRENARAGCNPLLPVRLRFSAPVAKAQLDRVQLKDGNGKTYSANKSEEAQPFDDSLNFTGPFPPEAKLTLSLPAKLTDDSGRTLINADRFPIKLTVAQLPPLVKFSGDFGIIERKAGSLLPLTLRNLEPGVDGTSAKLRWLHLERDSDILDWIKRLKTFENLRYERQKDRSIRDMRKERFLTAETLNLSERTLPKPNGASAFEVVGIPLPKPGYYVLEAESRRLGQALFGADQPMFVRTTALMTNLGVHFKWGPKNSLAWVTTLDSGNPVADALVAVLDCRGKLLAQGRTDAKGLSLIPRGLPDPRSAEWDCPLMVSARTGDDMAFALSNWDEGIETWRFGLPSDWEQEDRIVHSVLDRTLFRPGDTVHMKHLLREKRLTGLGYGRKSPAALEISHVASNQRWFLPLTWKNGAALSEWKIPSTAKRGEYNLRLLDKAIDPKTNLGTLEWQPGLDSGRFTVGDFRIPLMKASLAPLDPTLVGVDSATFDTNVTYQNGGAAKNLPIKLRGMLEPRYTVRFDDFEAYDFASRRPSENDMEESESLSLAADTLILDNSGTGRGRVTGIPALTMPHTLKVELEYTDPNGEIQTISRSEPWWPADIVLGIKKGDWIKAGQNRRLQFQAVDLSGKPVAEVPIQASFSLNNQFSYRVRLAGGFYGYRSENQDTPLNIACKGVTDAKGQFSCDVKINMSGEIRVDAIALDSQGRKAKAHQSYWVSGQDEQWFGQDNHDRMDLLPEKRSYQPGELARFQVRMPFRQATALVTVERDGILDAKVVTLSGKDPTIELKVLDTWAPNVFVSALVVRGRADEVRPTALVDLGKPAFKLGIAGISVDQQKYKLDVQVQADRTAYQIRDKAKVHIKVLTPNGKRPPAATDVAVAVVDEGLLELAPNDSWKLLDAMLAQRGYSMQTFTGQMHLTGKRHFGKKAVPGGGGGGRAPTRELFDTLVYWNPSVTLNAKGEADVIVPLNDSLTSFRIVAVAAGQERFGTGHASIRSSQDLQLISGLAPLVREGDRVQSYFTVRNSTTQAMKVRLEAKVDGLPDAPKSMYLTLEPGAGKEIKLPITVPEGISKLTWTVNARHTTGKATDSLKVTQEVAPAIPVQIQNTSLYRLDKPLDLPVAGPEGALPGRGDIRATLAATLGDGLSGLRTYMREYPYACLEQKVSKAIATRDRRAWEAIQEALPGYLDSNGLAVFFPGMERGSVALTAYLLAISLDAGYALPADVRAKFEKALEDFVAGRLDVTGQALPTGSDLNLRLAALDALSRLGKATPALIATINPEPAQLATTSLLDWIGILKRTSALAKRDAKLKTAEAALRARYTYTGQRMNLADADRDSQWWMMVSADNGAVRSLMTVLDLPDWRDDIPKLVSGILARQSRGHWNTTTANAWGVLTLERHAQLFEKVRPAGSSLAKLGQEARQVDWKRFPNGATANFPLPAGEDTLHLNHNGPGAPYVTLVTSAAVPLKEARDRGYSVRRELIPIEQKQPGRWSRGDIIRVHLTIHARDTMGWVVVNDPVPAGASILGSGLKRDSTLLTGDEASTGQAWPAWQERRFDSFQSYYEYVPRGEFSLEYTLRLNNAGQFHLPATRVEAMYAPEMYGAAPNDVIEVQK